MITDYYQSFQNRLDTFIQTNVRYPILDIPLEDSALKPTNLGYNREYNSLVASFTSSIYEFENDKKKPIEQEDIETILEEIPTTQLNKYLDAENLNDMFNIVRETAGSEDPILEVPYIDLLLRADKPNLNYEISDNFRSQNLAVLSMFLKRITPHKPDLYKATHLSGLTDFNPLTGFFKEFINLEMENIDVVGSSVKLLNIYTDEKIIHLYKNELQYTDLSNLIKFYNDMFDIINPSCMHERSLDTRPMCSHDIGMPAVYHYNSLTRKMDPIDFNQTSLHLEDLETVPSSENEPR